MSDLLSLIANLNSESPVQASSSPDDYAAELSLWTNAEFTFDMPPGLGIFEGDSGFDTAFTNNTASPLTSTPTTTPTATSAASSIDGSTSATEFSSPNLDFLNLPAQETRPLSLLERTRQRNPVNQDQPKPELHEQVAAVNSFHSLLAAYSASAQLQQIQQEQQNLLTSLQAAAAAAAAAAASASTTATAPSIPSPTPVLSAPTTPAAAKLLRQPMPQYKAEPVTKRQKTIPTPTSTPVSTVPSTPLSTTVEEPSSLEHDGYELSAADSFSKDDPEYLTKVAVEEDKRRRNTAASARFRQKKKLREQALEQTAREQTLRAEGLEARVKELEMEVRWLRGLIVEKDSRLHEASVSLQHQGIRL